MRHQPLRSFVTVAVGFILFAAATPDNHVALYASSGGPSLASLASTANLAAARKSMGSFEWGGNTYSWSVELTIGEPQEGLDPASESEYSVLHGPAVAEDAARMVTVPMTCFAAVWDDDGYYNNFTIALHLKDPGGNEISPTPAPAYVTNHSYLGTTNSWSLSDPSEGTYTCRPDLYVYGYYLGSPTYEQTLSYPIPSGETTEPGTWIFDTKLDFYQKLAGSGSFSGRRVREQNPGSGGPDTCSQDSPYGKLDAITGGEWAVDSLNGWGPDRVGYGLLQVQWARGHAQLPCSTQFGQAMQINLPGGQWQTYKNNTLKAGVTATTIWVERDGKRVEKPY